MESNYHYYSFGDYLITEISNELYSLMDNEYVLVRKHWMMNNLANLMGFRSARSSSLVRLYEEINVLESKVRMHTDNHHVLDLLSDFRNMLRDYQNHENIDV